MTSPDDAFLERLRGIAAAVDPPPELVTAMARTAFTTRRLDEELAELVLDSAEALTSVRSGTADVRVLSFEAGDVTVEVQVQEGPRGRELRGLVDGTQVETVTVEFGAAEQLVVAVDEDGWFTAAPVVAGPVRLRLGAVVTTWVVL
ncbi:hypothetical protein ACQEVB_34670 [Pseudonocardia sp. CA-107938]|uniref:hypothetical protein n=1 Tax=Pseudonocardia sp. CA-107938 TaxID=3240021 RepID=UPI003D89B49E